MAYIPWYDRLKPATLGERFGLNEISTARNTLSPTKSYAQKPPYNWEQGNWWDPNDQSVGGTQILEDFDHTTATMHKDGGRIDMKPGGLVEPGVTHYGDPAVKKLKNPPDPKKPWRYLRTGNQRKVGGAKRITQYFATEQEALAAQVEARKIKYEAATKVPKSDFNKIKQRIIKGETLEQIAETYKSTIKPIEKLLYDNNTNYTKLTPNVSYLEDADSLKYIKENYGKLKGETLGKALYPDLPASTQQARVRKLVTKLLAQKEIKYTPAALIEEVREEQGFNPEKSTKKVQTERVAAKKKFTVPVFETAMQGSKASQLSHMGVLYNEIVRFETLGYSPQRINQEVLKNVDPYLKTLVEKRATLLKNKPPGYEAKVNEINIKGEAVARATKGYKSFEVIEPSGKSYILGKDYAKSIDPLGHFEGKTIQEIAPEKISRRSKILEQMIPDPGERKLFIKNAKAVQKSQAKVSKAKIDKIAKDLTDLGFDTSPKVAIETKGKTIKKDVKKAIKNKLHSAGLGPVVWGSVFDDVLKQMAEGTSLGEALASQVFLGTAQKGWQERKYTKKHLTPEHVKLQNRRRLIKMAAETRITPFDLTMAAERDKEYTGAPHKYLEWLQNKIKEPAQEILWEERKNALETGMKMSDEKLQKAKQRYSDWRSVPAVDALTRFFSSEEDKEKYRKWRLEHITNV